MTLARRPRPYPRPRPLPLDAVTATRVDGPITDYEIDDEVGPPGEESFEFLGRHWWHEAHGVGLALAREWAEPPGKQ
jgi:hypothetical protein